MKKANIDTFSIYCVINIIELMEIGVVFFFKLAYQSASLWHKQDIPWICCSYKVCSFQHKIKTTNLIEC